MEGGRVRIRCTIPYAALTCLLKEMRSKRDGWGPLGLTQGESTAVFPT